MLTTASWVDEVRRLLGLEGVSQIWSEAPAWYFWLSEAPGPYELHLESVNDGNQNASATESGLFAVRFFPRPSGWAFPAFSREERELVTSDLFDDTNTICFEARESIHPHLFSIGTIGISFSREDDACALFTLETPELSRWRIREGPGLNANHVDRGSKGEDRGCVVRDVPAWRLARMLFDRLVSLHAFSVAARPARVILTSSPGFEVVQAEDGSVAVEETGDFSLNTLNVLFTGRSGAGDLIRDLEREYSGSDSRVVLDWTADCPVHARPPSEASDHVSEFWWTIGDVKRHSSLGSSCGCH